MVQIRHAGPHAPRKTIPSTSAKSVRCQQGPPASLDRASFPPSPDAHALRSPAASPNAHVHACSDVVACSRPHPPDMHGRSVLDACDPSCPPACPHLAASPDVRARTQPALVLPTIALHTDVHAPPRLRAHRRAHFGALPHPLLHTPNSDMVTTTTQRSCCRDRHAVVVTTRPPRPGPCPCNSDAVTTTTRPPRVHRHARAKARWTPASSTSPSRAQQRRGDDDDATIATA